MSSEGVPQLLKTKQLKLTWDQCLRHYNIAILSGGLALMILIDLVRAYENRPYKDIDSFLKHLPLILFLLSIATIDFIIKRRELHFRELKLKQTFQQFTTALHRTVKTLGWHIETSDANHTIAYRSDRSNIHRREIINIIRDEQTVWINSMVDPDCLAAGSLALSWNAKNMRVFNNHVDDVIAGRIMKPLPNIAMPNEWTVPNMLLRALVWSICFALIAIGIWLISNWKLVGIAAIIPAVFCVVFDVMALRESWKTNQA